MRCYFYIDENGNKQGPFGAEQLKKLVKQVVIRPDTLIETEDGRRCVAGQVHSLFETENDSVTLLVGENCRNLGCNFTVIGFILCFIGGFLWGAFNNTPADTPAGVFLIIAIYALIGIGGFLLSVGPILFVVGLVIPSRHQNVGLRPKT